MYQLGASRHVSNLSHSDLRTWYGIRSREKDRAAYFLGNLSGPNRELQINDGSIHTLRTALLTRMFYHNVDGQFLEPPKVMRVVIEGSLGRFRSLVLRNFGPRPTPVSPEHFVEMYHGRRRTLMSNALDRLTQFGLTRGHGETKAFVKLEKVKVGKAPRCIQPRAPEYNISVGVFLKPIEHRLYRSIQRLFGSSTPVVAKGLNALEVGETLASKWGEFYDPVAIGLDAEAFDLHVCASMLAWEHSVYLGLYQRHYQARELARLLKWQINNRGSGYCYDGKLKYRVIGRRFSGDMNTAMGNCLIMCGVVFAYCHHRFPHYQVLNNGDDCVVIIERSELGKFDAFKEHAFTLGFRIKLEKPVDVLEEIEFCQAKPVKLRGSTVMVRTPDKAREKDSISLLHHQNINSIRKWLTAVGECGMSLCSGCPVMQEFYLSYLRNGLCSGKISGAMGMDTGASFLARGMDSLVRRVTPESRDSFYAAFNYTPDEQIALENHFKRWKLVDGIQKCGELLQVATFVM